MQKRLSIVISGRVHGVGFRFFTRDAARRHGILGWVKNRPDGTVEAEGQGDALSVEQFCAELREGPHLSRVEGIEIAETPVVEGEDAFRIRHW